MMLSYKLFYSRFFVFLTLLFFITASLASETYTVPAKKSWFIFQSAGMVNGPGQFIGTSVSSSPMASLCSARINISVPLQNAEYGTVFGYTINDYGLTGAGYSTCSGYAVRDYSDRQLYESWSARASISTYCEKSRPSTKTSNSSGQAYCEYTYEPQAGLPPDDCDAGTGKQGASTVGNPIQISTGNKTQTETDYRATGVFPLVVERTFNSLFQPENDYETRIPRKWFSSAYRNINAFDVASLVDFPEYYEGEESIIPVRVEVRRTKGRKLAFTNEINLISRTTEQVAWSSYARSKYTLSSVNDENGKMIGFALKLPNDVVEYFDIIGRLKKVTHKSGLSHYYEYNTEGMLSKISDDFDRELVYTHENGQLVRIDLPDETWLQYNYEYSPDNYLGLDSVRHGHLENGVEVFSERKYLYSTNSTETNLLVGIVDERGMRQSTWEYENLHPGLTSTGHYATSYEDALGARYELQYDGPRTTVTHPNGVNWTYDHTYIEGMPYVSEETCSACNGLSKKFEYNANGQRTRYEDFQGNVTTYVFDDNNNEISRTEALGTPEERTITTQWHSEFRSPVRITSPDRIIEYDYNESGLRTSVRMIDRASGAVRETRYTYNSLGLLETVDGPRTDVNDITTYEYNAMGNRSRTINALGQVSQVLEFDANGRPLRQVDANGVETVYTYDYKGRVLTRTFAGATTTFEYDSVGNLLQLTRPNGSYVAYEYDVINQLVGINDAQGNSMTYTYDLMGNRTGESVNDPQGVLRRNQAWAYDLLNRMVNNQNGNGHADDYAYDYNNNRTEHVDALGRTTTSSYDALDRMVSTLDALNGSSQYVYDAEDNLISVTDPLGLTTTYTYNGLGDKVEQNSPDTGITTYTHDVAGNQLTQTDARGITASYVYDALDRVTSVSYPDTNLNVSYEYDQGLNGIGRLTRMTDGSGSTNYLYDARGNLIQETTSLSNQSYLTSYAYDLADNLVGITYPSGREVSYTYNGNNQIESVSTTYNGISQTLLSNITWESYGPVASMTYGNGLVSTSGYDLAQQLTSQATPGVREVSYTWDEVGNITGITHNNVTLDQAYVYDELNRLTYDSGEYGYRNYLYDSNGNRLERLKVDNVLDENGLPTTSSKTQTYNYDSTSQQLLGINNGLRSYDETGNTLSKNSGKKQWIYADHNRPISFTKDGILTAEYRYNGQGERVEKIKHKSDGSIRTVHYHFDPQGRLLGLTRYNDAGQLKTEKYFVWLGSTPVSQITQKYTNDGTAKPIETVYLHADHLNTPRVATNDAQAIVWRWDSDAFGQGGIHNDVDGDDNNMNDGDTYKDIYCNKRVGVCTEGQF